MAALATSSCSIRGMAIDSIASGVAASGDLFAADDDPELVRAAAPFGLKTMEGLAADRPRNGPLLLAVSRGFTQYAYAFLDTDALLLEHDDPEAARAARARALGLYLRGRDYALRALELRRPGTARALRLDPTSAVTGFRREDVPLLYWTAAAWGGAIAASGGDPVLLADFPAVGALVAAAYALDPDYDRGSLHEAMISLESVPAIMGGSPERARAHFERAVAVSGGLKAGPYLALALGVAVPQQDRAGFETLLRRALAVDVNAEPSLRLANLISQRRARHLLEKVDWLFLDDESEYSEEGDSW
jgi:predicted anti-sigma-YlaC factor YlaD